MGSVTKYLCGLPASAHQSVTQKCPHIDGVPDCEGHASVNKDTDRKVCVLCGHDDKEFGTFAKAPRQCCTYIGGGGSGMCLCFCVFPEPSTTPADECDAETDVAFDQFLRADPEVQATLKDVAREHCEQLMKRRINGVAVRDVEADEIWGFVGCKNRHKLHKQITDPQLGEG